MARQRMNGAAPKGGKKKTSQKHADARVQAKARKRSPEPLDLPGVEAERDKDLEKYGRELGGLDDEAKSNRRLRQACQARIDRRLSEIGVHAYRLIDGRMLSATDKRTVKLSPAPAKKPKTRKRKRESDHPTDAAQARS